MTPRNLINSALRAINAIGATDTPSADVMDDSRELFNMLLDSWSVEELLPQDYVQTSFDLVSGQVNYTIVDGATEDRDGIFKSATVTGAITITMDGALVAAGVATMDVPRHVTIYGTGDSDAMTFTVTGTNTYGDTITEVLTGPNNSTVTSTKQFKTVTSVASSASATGSVEVGSGAIIDIRRPIRIVSAFCRTSTGADTSVLIKSRDRYNEIPDKDESGTPTILYYDRLYPSGEIYIHPVPAVATLDLFVDLWLPFKTIASTALDTDINLPSEYLLAFRWNLAAELAPEYGKNVTEFVYARAQDTKNVIRKLNGMPPKPLKNFAPVAIVDNQPAANQS